ncbi:sugar phosphate isomerase/epimerase family protein [Streptomyces sp. NPDC093252]|uniref:sugar phosphate isomerase/epimerase family protein n=1 Tax=Streptomyces sp. NPDC093252 TaxID=3154980 RepID=UPI003442D822
MKLAFSTLGVPGLPLSDVLTLATRHGYHGVELRAHPEEPVHPGIGPAERTAARTAFEDAGIEPLGLAGYVRVAAPGDDTPVLDELRALVDLARDLGAPHVRVFPGGDPDGDPDRDPDGDPDRDPAEADAAAVRRLTEGAAHAADAGVRILLETHDSHRTGAAVARVLGPVHQRSVGALWDVMHTWLGGEQPAQTFAALAPHLGYVQVKDIASADDTTPLPLGAGILPLGECVEVLTRGGWDGWLCWEYEKRWYEAAAPLPDLLAAGRDHLGRLLHDAA